MYLHPVLNVINKLLAKTKLVLLEISDKSYTEYIMVVGLSIRE